MSGFFAKLFKTNRREFEERLQDYLVDSELDDEEIESLNEIAAENELSSKDLAAIYKKTYAELFVKITGGGSFNAKIYEKLKSIQKTFGLGEEEAMTLVRGQAEKLFLNILRDVTASLKGSLNPIETDIQLPDSENYADKCEMYLNFCASKLNIDLEDLARRNMKDFADYTYAKAYYSLSQGSLPIMNNPGILLKNGEICYFYEVSELIEEKTVSTRVGGYSGVSVRVAKGVTLHTGGSRGHTLKHAEKTITDTGMLVITNKRIIFSGQKKTISIPYSKVVVIIKYDDAITVSRTGKTKFEAFTVGDPNLIEMIIMAASER